MDRRNSNYGNTYVEFEMKIFPLQKIKPKEKNKI